MSSSRFIKEAFATVHIFSDELARICRTSIYPAVEKIVVEISRLLHIVYKETRSILVAGWKQTRIHPQWAAKHVDRHLYRMHVWISQKEKCMQLAFVTMRPALDHAAAKIKSFLSQAYVQTENAAKRWHGLYRLCSLCTEKAAEFWKLLLSRLVGEHRRLTQWHRKVLHQSPAMFVTSWIRSVRKAIAFMIPGSFSKSRESLDKASTGKQDHAGTGKPVSAWWAGPPADKEEQMGTNSWMELKKIVLAWSAASERKEGAREEPQQDKEVSAASEWFITQSTGGSTLKVISILLCSRSSCIRLYTFYSLGSSCSRKENVDVGNNRNLIRTKHHATWS
jgi:hypothetical protein